jgi:hypothetical protein
MIRSRRRLHIATIALSLAAGGFGLAACDGGSINATTTCAQYLQQPQSNRYDAATRLSSELHASDPGNPMWGMSLDAACGADPNMTVGQYFSHPGG